MSLLDLANEILEEQGEELLCAPIDVDYENRKYCLYRFLDANKSILYIGKCEKSQISDGRGGKKEYFIRDRITQHYTPTSKQLPKSLYINTRYIEVCFPDVSDGQELEVLESQLISFYERNKFQCNYNSDLMHRIAYTEEDNMNWILYDEKSDRDIKVLMKKYEYQEIPPIETINERLRSILWVLNNKLEKRRD